MASTFHAFIDPMIKRKRGTLVGIASVAGIRGLPGSEAYCASKSAAITYCESLRVEMQKYGVKVVTISPGFVKTPLTAHNPYKMPFIMDGSIRQRSRQGNHGRQKVRHDSMGNGRSVKNSSPHPELALR